MTSPANVIPLRSPSHRGANAPAFIQCAARNSREHAGYESALVGAGASGSGIMTWKSATNTNVNPAPLSFHQLAARVSRRQGDCYLVSSSRRVSSPALSRMVVVRGVNYAPCSPSNSHPCHFLSLSVVSHTQKSTGDKQWHCQIQTILMEATTQ